MKGEVLFLTTTPGLESVLLAEASLLGEARAVAGGVRVTGPLGVHRRANLSLRTASRVMLELGQIKSTGKGGFRRALLDLDWGRYLRPGVPQQLETIASGGVSERELKIGGALLPGGGPLVRLRAEAEGIWVSLDTSGELLYRRGYRQEVSRAPLRETLAAGLLALAKHLPGEPLWDPLCGSGTIAIEAASRARRLAPGLLRSFAFEQFPGHDGEGFAAEKEALRRAALPAAPAPVWATDLNAGALGTARRNARRAGVASDLTFERHDAATPKPGLAPGALAIANLPYGRRVGSSAELPAFYSKLVRSLRRSGVARVALLAHDSAAATWLDLPAGQALAVENGGLGCRLILATL